MQNDIPLVTVLTLVYNGLPHLKESIESTLNQSYEDFIFLIIDDASTDPEVIKLVESYDDPRIDFLKNEVNLGVADTFNKALNYIKTPYTVRVDQDDINLPNRIKDQIDFLQTYPNISILSSWEYKIDDAGNKCGQWKGKCNNYGEFIGPILLCICPILHPSLAFRTKDMISAGGFNKAYTRAEDFEVTAKLASKRYSAAVLNEFHLLQRQHDASQSREFESEQTRVAHQVHSEIISKFTDFEGIEPLAKFLRLELNILQLDKKILKELCSQTRRLIQSVIIKNNLSKIEQRSLYLTFFKRIGFGFYFEKNFSFLPKSLYLALFLLLSPQHENKIRAILKKIYNAFF